MATTTNPSPEHIATARALNLPISTKQSAELSNALRFHSTLFAKKYLEDVMSLRQAVPFVRSTKDLGHKAGISSGRFPQKAAREFLRLVKAVEANAQVKGLNAGSLKIIKLVANKASIPQGAGRQGRGTKRTHLEIRVQEGKTGTKSAAKGTSTKSAKTERHPVTSAAPVASSVSAPVAGTPSSTKSSTTKAPEVDMVKAAKQRAAQIAQREQQAREKQSLHEVSELYEELKKKGSLRGKGELR